MSEWVLAERSWLSPPNPYSCLKSEALRKAAAKVRRALTGKGDVVEAAEELEKPND